MDINGVLVRDPHFDPSQAALSGFFKVTPDIKSKGSAGFSKPDRGLCGEHGFNHVRAEFNGPGGQYVRPATRFRTSN